VGVLSSKVRQLDWWSWLWGDVFHEIAGCVYVVKDFDGLLDTVPSNSGITRYKTHATRTFVGAILPVLMACRTMYSVNAITI